MYSGLELPSPRQTRCTESPSRTQPSVVAGLSTQKCTCSVGSKGKGQGERVSVRSGDAITDRRVQCQVESCRTQGAAQSARGAGPTSGGAPPPRAASVHFSVRQGSEGRCVGRRSAWRGGSPRGGEPEVGEGGGRGLTVQGEAEGRAVQAAVLALRQVEVCRAVELGVPVVLLRPQVQGAGERVQPRGLPDGAAGYVALWRGAGGGSVGACRHATHPPTHAQLGPCAAAHLRSSPWAPAGPPRSGTT